MSIPNILFLADTSHPASAVQDHINAITSDKRMNWHVINPLSINVLDKLNFSMFDAIGVHYSITPYNHYYLSSQLKKKIADYQGTKFIFLQDEYQEVNKVQDYLHQLNFNILFTLVNEHLVSKAYPDPRLNHLKKITVLTAYVSDEMKHYPCLDIKERTIDVSYRARRCDYWLGSLAYEKQYIADQFISKTSKQHLKLNISLEESDRLYGKDWINLLTNSRAVLGTESGASIWDFDGSVKKKTLNFLQKNRKASFSQIYEQVLKPYDGHVLYSAVSPRIFEAAATKTPMIMFPGFYSGVCQPEKHYIVLKKDFSNLNEVIEKLKDDNFLQELAERTFKDLILSKQFSQHQFSNQVTDEIIKEIQSIANYQPDTIVNELNRFKQKYRFLNRLRRLKAEACFITNQVIELLFSKRYSFMEKIKMFNKQVNRYFVYIIARMKR